MLETSVSHVSRGEFALQRESQESMTRETVARQREREETEDSVISVAEPMSMKSLHNSIKSHSLPTHGAFFSDERDLREDLERRAQQAVLGENSAQRKLYLTLCDLEIQNWDRRNSECALIESRRELESQKDDDFWKSINGQIKLSVREYMCVVNWRWRTVFTGNATQEVAKKLKNWEDAATKKKMEWHYKIWWIFHAAWSGISNSELITGSNSEITRSIEVYWRFENFRRSWLTEQFWQCPRFTSSSFSLELQKT